MGGSGSKQDNLTQNRESSNTLEDETLPVSKKHPKDKKKKKQSDKAKDKDGKKTKKKKKKQKDTKKNHEGCKIHKSISFNENVVNDANACPQVCRKKSACPSCDASDVLMYQIRSRSSSLRYSDFNKVIRQSRIRNEDEDMAEIPLIEDFAPVAETVCFICGVYTGSVTRTCRVCYHVYHNGCLKKIKKAMNEHTMSLAQKGLWSCHQCSDISRLLTQEETHHAATCLEEFDIDPDSLDEEDYIHYKKKISIAVGRTVTSEAQETWSRRFRTLAGQDRSHIDWSLFLHLETISILLNRCKSSLIRLMTEAEFDVARQMFKEIDNSGNTTMAQVKSSIIGLYKKFKIAWPQDVEDASGLEQEDMSRCVNWGEFLRLLSIHMISVRENSLLSSSSTDSYDNADIGPSFDSVDGGDYRSCDSDLESTTTEATMTTSQENVTATLDLSDVQTLDGTDDDANKSLSILDDLSRAFNLEGGTAKKNENCAEKSDKDEAIKDYVSEIESEDSPKRHLWQNAPSLLQNPNFTKRMDVPETGPVFLDRKVVNRQSEILVRPSTEEGRSPRRVLSQKLVAPAYGLVDKMQSQDWGC